MVLDSLDAGALIYDLTLFPFVSEAVKAKEAKEIQKMDAVELFRPWGHLAKYRIVSQGLGLRQKVRRNAKRTLYTLRPWIYDLTIVPIFRQVSIDLSVKRWG